jgi:uncharacterized protein (TIRG00374 family)
MRRQATRIAVALLSLLLGILLFAASMRQLGMSPGEVLELLVQPGYLVSLPLLLVPNFLHFYLTAAKWRYVLKHFLKGANPRFSVYRTTLATALCGVVMPYYLAAVLVRTYVMKRSQRLPVTTGLSISVYDALTDVACYSSATLIALPFFLQAKAPFLAAGMVLAALATAFVFALSVLGRVKRAALLLAFMARKRTKNAFLRRNLFVLMRVFHSPAFRPMPVAWTMLMSTVRVLPLAVSATLIAPCFGIPRWPVFLGSAPIQLASLLNLTPGNLGVSEWTWIGVFAAFGVNQRDAFEFSFAHRIILIVNATWLWLLEMLRAGLTGGPSASSSPAATPAGGGERR